MTVHSTIVQVLTIPGDGAAQSLITSLNALHEAEIEAITRVDDHHINVIFKFPVSDSHALGVRLLIESYSNIQ